MSAVQRVLVGVADSPSGMAAARTAVSLASALGAPVRAVHVLADGELAAVVAGAGNRTDVARRRDTAALAVLRHVAELGERAGVAVTTVELLGDVSRCLLAEAREWGADLVVVGRTTRRGAGQPFAGPELQEVLEFSELPVLVVPA